MTEKAMALVRAEWDALSRLPHLQRVLYLVLRWHMDVLTRRVGLTRGISLKGLCEELEVDAAPGRSDSGAPSRKAVRSALDQLEKHGLVQPCGNGEVLVFLLPKASRVSARQKIKGHERGTGSGHAMGHGESFVPQANPQAKGHAFGHPQNPLKGHTSEVIVNPLYTEASTAFCPREELSTGSVLLLLLPAGMAERLRVWERQRGKVAQAASSDPLLAEWARRGVDESILREAYDMAVISREVKNNPAPINPGFVDVFVNRILKGRGAGRKVEEASAAAPWQYSTEGVAAMARRYGVEAIDGEPIEALRSRVELAKLHADEAAKKRRRDDHR